MAQTVKCLSAMLETRVRSLGREDSLERTIGPMRTMIIFVCAHYYMYCAEYSFWHTLGIQ